MIRWFSQRPSTLDGPFCLNQPPTTKEDFLTSASFDHEGWIEACIRIGFELSPVGVRYSVEPPEGVPRLEGSMRLCEMLYHAQQGNAFYAAAENHLCGAALYALGKDLLPVYTSGVYGTGLEVFDSPRSGSRLYDHIPRLQERRGIEYVTLAPLDSQADEPDLLIIAAREEQSEVILRAMSYSTGKMWASKSTGVIGCAWLFVYPYLTGELNYIPILSMGMRALNLFPRGMHLLSIPFDMFGAVLDGLKRMPMTLTALGPGGDEFRKDLLMRLGLDPTH
jgi:uncharacterized protein (DUF169 family)